MENNLTQSTLRITRREPQRKIKRDMVEKEIIEILIGCAIKVHKTFGPGLLESEYEECMDYELRKTFIIEY